MLRTICRRVAPALDGATRCLADHRRVASPPLPAALPPPTSTTMAAAAAANRFWHEPLATGAGIHARHVPMPRGADESAKPTTEDAATAESPSHPLPALGLARLPSPSRHWSPLGVALAATLHVIAPDSAHGGRRSSHSHAGPNAEERRLASIPPPTWADRHCPQALLPFVKLSRADAPIGTHLLFLPCSWSICLAADSGSIPDVYLLSLFAVGAFLLRSAGCTINDLWDMRLDARVARTKHRPLAAGTISPQTAVAFLAAQLTLGLGVLLHLNDYTKVLGASSLLLVGSYPAMKRITYWPQAVLGLTINWGAMLGYSAVRGACDWGVVLPLYAAGIAWTLLYDTIYAHQDKVDDLQTGIKSTALLFGQDTKLWLSGFAALSCISFGMTGLASGAGPLYYAGVCGAASHYAWQIMSVNLKDPTDCWNKFDSNKWLGAMITAGIVADGMLG